MKGEVDDGDNHPRPDAAEEPHVDALTIGGRTQGVFSDFENRWPRGVSVRCERSHLRLDGCPGAGRYPEHRSQFRDRQLGTSEERPPWSGRGLRS